MLRQLAPRIAQLQLVWEVKDMEEMNLPLFLATQIGQTEFSLLKAFTLTHCVDEAQSEEPTFVMNIPILRSLEIWADKYYNVPRIRCENLVDLHYQAERFDILDIVYLLAQFPNLEKAIFSNELLSQLQWHALPVVSLRNLRELYICQLWLSEMEHLLRHLDAPSLTKLGMDIADDRHGEMRFERFLKPYIAWADALSICSADHHVDLYSLTSKSGRSLTVEYASSGDYDMDCEFASLPTLASYPSHISTFELSLPPPPVPDLVDALRCWSSITHIVLHADEEDDSTRLFTALMAIDAADSAVVCPLLKSLDLTESIFNTTRLTQFLEFRQGKNVPVRELKVPKGWRDFDSPKEFVLPLVEVITEVDAPSWWRRRYM